MSFARSAEKLFNAPRLYRAKFAVTGAVVAVTRPLLFRDYLTVDDTIAAANIPAGATMCEIGCGDGENYRTVQRIVGNVAYTGIDINPAMVAHCTAAFPEQRWLRTVPPYPFADGTFDVVLIVNVLHHLNSIDDITGMLREAARIGRTIVLFEPLQSEHRALYALKSAYWRATDGGFRYNRLAEFHELFAAAGLRVTWERYTAPLRHFYGAHLVREELTPEETPPARRFGVRGHAALNALWLGMQFQDASILAIVVPAILLRTAPATHTGLLAAIATAVATAWVFAPPIAGALSDRARRRGGDRRVQTAIALGIDIVALLALAISHAAGAIAAEVVCAGIAIATASSIYQALLPEVVPREAWGASAGARGAMTLIGTVAGLAAAALLPPPVAVLAMAAAIALVLPSLAAIPREGATEPRARRAVVRDRHDLNVTVVARGWIVLGMTLLNTYVLYFFSDVLHVGDASLGTGMVAGAALIGAILSSVLAGVLSDKLDRRLVVALSGVPMVAAALGFAIAPERGLIFAYAALFGLGYGGVFSVGWALALDAVPELGDVARDLGVWGTLSNLPGVAAPALGAWIIAHGATPRDGYRALFAVAALAFGLGSLTVLRVGRRPVSSLWSILLLSIVIVVRQPWLATKFRVRQWGRLPFRRGPTLLIANHQHEDESEIVAERSFVQGAWHSTTLTASSRRMWEPGWFAGRLPALAPLTRSVNAGPFFEALGMYPLENELAARPLRSIAYAVERVAPGAAAADVFRGGALAALPPGTVRVADLLEPRNLRAADVRVKVASVNEPYRRMLLDAMRAEIDADVAHIVDLVKRGATFYITPEGFYSTDGRMRPLKGIVDHLIPVADVRLAAIAFDPFRGRRLSLLYQVRSPADPHDLARSLAAARPVTASALLATWMLAVALPFTAAEAEDGVVRAREALPADAFVDPEVVRDAPATVREALAVLRRRGTLTYDGARYALADARRDARFPLVDDIVTYQATFLAETLAACRGERRSSRPLS